MCKFRQLYFELMPPVTIVTTFLGVLTGVTMDESKYLHKQRYNLFTHIIACGTIGAVTGMTFPVSFPIITIYALNVK